CIRSHNQDTPKSVVAETLAIVNCSQLVTLAGAHKPRTGGDLRQLAIIEDGAMFLRGEKIEAVGRRRDIETAIDQGTEVIDAGQRVVTPGFVDAHTHPVFAGMRADEFEQRAPVSTY